MINIIIYYSPVLVGIVGTWQTRSGDGDDVVFKAVDDALKSGYRMFGKSVSGLSRCGGGGDAQVWRGGGAIFTRPTATRSS